MPEAEKIRSKVPAYVASACSAVTITWLSSFAGVSGTLIGVALSSGLSGVVVALYERSIRRGHSAVARHLHRQGKPDPWARYYRPAEAVRRFDIPWRRAAILGGCALVVALGTVLAAEAVAHKPVAAIVSGQPGTGCSVCGGKVNPPASPSPTPVPSVTPSPSPSPTLSPSPAASGPPSPSPSLSPSPSPSATVSSSPTPVPDSTP